MALFRISKIVKDEQCYSRSMGFFLKKQSVVIVFVLLLSRLWAQGFNVVEQEENRARLQVVADAPDFPAFSADDSLSPDVLQPDWPRFRAAQGYALPYRPILVQLNSRKAHVEIIFHNEKRMPSPPPKMFHERVVGADSLQDLELSPGAAHQSDATGLVELHYLGQFRQNYLWRVEVYPYDYDARTSELIFRGSILFDVVGDDALNQNVQPVAAYDKDFLTKLGAVSMSQTQQSAAGSILKKNAAADIERWKIIVGEDGIYRVTGRDLLDAGAALLNIDFRNIRLTRNGRDVSLYPHGWRDGQFDAEDYIEFWGEEQRQTFQEKAPDMYQDPFTKNSVYWLSWEKRGQWMAEESGQISNSNPGESIRPYSFLDTIHHEEDNYYDHLSSVPIDTMRDHWFFDDGVSAGKKVDYKIFLHDPDDQSPLQASAHVMMSGRTTILNLSHNISAYLNGSFLFSHRWDGQNIADLRSADDSFITGADLSDGENTLSIVNNVTPQNFDFVLLNWFEVTYPRLYRAHEDFLKFRIPPNYDNGTFLFRIDGFVDPQIDIYKLQQSKIIGGIVEETTDFNGFTSMQVSFQNDVLSPETEFVAVSNSAKKKPLLIKKDNPSDLKNKQLSADYVLIAHNRFITSPALQDLIELRQAQGLRTLVVNVQDIYDEFSFGQPSSYAVKDFLAWAYANWQPPQLKYVLLVGDGSYIRYSAEGDTLDFIPVHMRQTEVYGSAASDFWYSLVSGEDEVPDINIGRLPVRTPAELEALIAKIVRYEKTPPHGDWPNRFLVIGGNGVDFRSQGIALSKAMPPQFNTRLLFTVKDQQLADDPYFGGTSDLLDYVDRGCSVVTFHGHGGGAIWADNGLLRLDDIDRFYTQGKFPFILSMTCYTGSFESPVRESLADALLFSENEGAIAMLGASGVGWTWNDYFLQTEIMKQVFNNPDMTIGEMVTAGKIAYLAHYKTAQVVSEINQYHLLGDPASHILLPQQQVQVRVDNPVLFKGDSVRASCATPFAAGTAYFDAEDSVKAIVVSSESDVSNNAAAATLHIPDDFEGESGLIRFYGADEFGGRRANGFTAISLKGAVFDSAYVRRTPEDSLYFYVHIGSRSALREVKCLALNDTLIMQATGDDWYASTRAVTVIWSGFQFSYYFQATDVDNNSFNSRLYKYYISLDVDVAVDSSGVAFSGDELVYLETTINNTSSNDVAKVPVLFEYRVLDAASWTAVGRDTVSVAAFGSKKCKIFYAPAPGPVDIRITVDPDSSVQEKNRKNNSIVKRLTPHLFQATSRGFIVNGQAVQQLLYDGIFEVALPAAALSVSTALFVDRLKNINIQEQPDFSGIAEMPAYQLSLMNDNAELLKSMSVKVHAPFDSSLSESGDVALFRFTRQTKKWVRCETVVSDSLWQATLPQVGNVAILKSKDVTPPDVQVAVDGQPYVLKKWAASQPRLSVRLQDVNGVDISAGRLRFELNGRDVEADDIALPDSIRDGNQIIISYNPTLQSGEHVLTVQATDCNQNESEIKEFIFRVAGAFDIQMLGNYPNPFQSETRFAYLFNSPVDDMSLKIFTASGRLIRRIQPSDVLDDPNPLGADYHEILWDGLDAEGYETANGVYFYSLSAKSDGKTKTVTGKLAKVK